MVPDGLFALCTLARARNSQIRNRGTMSITVYSKHHCPQCSATKRQLEKIGAEYREINIEEHPEVVPQLQAAGFQQVPVVITADKHWTGYRPDLLRELGQKIEAESCAQALA